MRGGGVVVVGLGLGIERGETEQQRALLDEAFAGGVEQIHGSAFAKIGDQHDDGAAWIFDQALGVAHGLADVRAAADEAEGAKLAAARRNAFSALARVRPTTILEDVTVPRSELAAMVAFIDSVAKKHKLQIGTFGHLGDGNLHPTFLTNERDHEEMHRIEVALEEIVEETIRLGGTVTGEHGVGLAKKAFLKRQLGEGSYELMRSIKLALDPQGLLNPGKIFDLRN